MSIDPVYFAAIWPLEGPRTAPTSGFRISYGFLHTAEAAALVTGDSRMLASTPWRERNALEAGLRIDYRSPGRAPRSITGRLVVQRGDPVFLAPEPVTVASDGPTTEGMVSAGRVFFLRLPPKGGQWRVDQAWNEDESGRRAEIQVVFDRTQEDGDYFRAMGNERVIQVIFAAPERLVFRLAVLPTPKC
ncbi:MAG: hypothetical protein FJX47_11515 [Alphaproteobacteria bacterium]|nr:hypothetical protein [Alphaproteobacteria bacterium]